MDSSETVERTRVWMASNSSLIELTDRANVMLASIEADNGAVSRMEVIVTPMSADVVLYTAWITYRERFAGEDEDE